MKLSYLQPYESIPRMASSFGFGRTNPAMWDGTWMIRYALSPFSVELGRSVAGGLLSPPLRCRILSASSLPRVGMHLSGLGLFWCILITLPASDRCQGITSFAFLQATAVLAQDRGHWCDEIDSRLTLY